MIGYCGGGYRIWCPEERRVVLSRDVSFDENVFYYKSNQIVLEQPKNSTKGCQKSPTKLSPTLVNKQQRTDERQDELFEPDEVEEFPITKSPNNQSKTMRPTRAKKMRLYLKEYDVYNAYCLLTSFQPETFEEATKDDDWKKAIKTELSHTRNLEHLILCHFTPRKKGH